MINRKRSPLTISLIIVTSIIVACSKANSEPQMTVYKSPTCGCCQHWIDHLQAAGIKAAGVNDSNMSLIKDKMAIPTKHRSCHTGVISHAKGEYIFEGHIPAKIIQRFLDNPPEGAIGLAVPGMPIGSPGMEMGNRKDPYNVMLLLKNGEDQVYEKVNF